MPPKITDKKLFTELTRLVDNAIEMYPHGNDGIEAMKSLYEFWMIHRDRVRWAFWAGPGDNPDQVIYCWREPDAPHT